VSTWRRRWSYRAREPRKRVSRRREQPPRGAGRNARQHVGETRSRTRRPYPLLRAGVVSELLKDRARGWLGAGTRAVRGRLWILPRRTFAMRNGSPSQPDCAEKPPTPISQKPLKPVRRFDRNAQCAFHSARRPYGVPATMKPTRLGLLKSRFQRGRDGRAARVLASRARN
jgi:hypothetical protein